MVIGMVASVGAVGVGLFVDGAPVILQTPTILIGPVVSAVIVAVSLLTRPTEDVDSIWLRMHGTAQDRAVERLAEATLATDL
jgi:hypothetical protein